MIVVSGNKGQLGYDIERWCTNNDIACKGTDKEDLDITDVTQVQKFFKTNHFDAFIHCSAYTAVDKAEEQPELCYKVNTLGVQYLVNACKQYGRKFMLLSTDYVFNGRKEGYYMPEDQRDPLSVYGKSKALAETYVEANLHNYFILRISWAFGLNGHNFIRTMLKLSESKNELNIVSDQYGTPTYTKDVAPLIVQMIQTDKYGIYHATNEGYCSWAEFAEYIFKKINAEVKVNHILTTAYPTPAQRPLNSRLDRTKLTDAGFERLPHWHSAVDRYLEELGVLD
jgi:dTDP-4-dehydrorhamnose reductase